MSAWGNLFVRWFSNARRMFHLAVGLAFLFLAVAGVEVTLRFWGDYRKSPGEGVAGFAMVGSFTVLLIVFSLYSFVRARSVR